MMSCPVLVTHRARLLFDHRDPPRYTRRTFEGWEGYPRNNPLFHSLGCAERFAIAAHKAGYRIVRKEKP